MIIFVTGVFQRKEKKRFFNNRCIWREKKNQNSKLKMALNLFLVSVQRKRETAYCLQIFLMQQETRLRIRTCLLLWL